MASGNVKDAFAAARAVDFLQGDLADFGRGKRLAEDTLSVFFEVCDHARRRSREARNDAALIRRAWSLLANARVFVIDPADFLRAYRASDIYTRDVAGVHRDQIPSSQEEADHIVNVCDDEADKVPFPEKLPFDTIFLGYGARLDLGERETAYRIGHEAIEEVGVRKATLLGHVIGYVGNKREAFTFVRVESREGSLVTFVSTYSEEDASPVVTNDDELRRGWQNPMSLDPWTIQYLVDAINERKNLTLETPGLAVKMARKAVMKHGSGGQLPLPMPYYVVRVEDAFHEASAAKLASTPRSLQYSHRFDVRGHDCVRVARGKLPISPEDAVKLKKRNYVLYDVQPIATEHFEMLEKRGIRRGPDEWLAILVYRRDAYVKGAPDLPYVPAARVLR